ncbi:MAG: YkgJ family cysteine cluster protein [Promethearchaeota archaeon]
MINKCENCGLCCYETEMILSSQDIELILSNNPKGIMKEDFVFKNKDGFYQLKNRNGHCVFLNGTSKTCKIYNIRPQGCKFYPLIYDFYKKKCIIDEECPRIHLFYQNKNKLKSICDNLKKFARNQLNINLN